MRALWSAKWYLLLGLFSYTLFLAVTAPLDFVWRHAQSHVGRLPVQIKHISGTLWQGQAQVQIPQLGGVTANWELSVAELLKGTLAGDLQIKGDGLKATGYASVGLNKQLTLADTEIFMSSSYLQPMLRQGRATLVGDFEVNKLNTVFDLQQRQVLDAEGRLIFTGGDVSFPVDGKPINATLPMLVGRLSKPTEKVELSLATTDGDSIGSGYLQADGWGGFAIKRRFLDILGQKWPKDVDEESVIFEVSQKLL